MVEFIPLPEPHLLLPPLLACLPTAFASNSPPPALLPLLSPILRQRVQILSSVSSSPSDSWLRLLCWNAGKAERVCTIVGATTFEPHPVSGEIEIGDDVPVHYKRLDPETLRSRLVVPDYNLTAQYVWCSGDQEGGGPGWRLAELLPGDDADADEDVWSGSIGAANELRQEKIIQEALKEAEEHPAFHVGGENARQEDEEEEDDDDYWAQYDNTPGRTPNKRSPAPMQHQQSSLRQQSEVSDMAYFDSYNEVQPALDNDDPSMDKNEVGESSLNGNLLASMLRRQSEGAAADEASPNAALGVNGLAVTQEPTVDPVVPLSHPRPSSASSVGSDAVSRLEQTAETQSASEVGVKQHISSNIKSLFRLARSTGMSRVEFEAIVKTELELLSLIDADDDE